jgi:hypothetical protein
VIRNYYNFTQQQFNINVIYQLLKHTSSVDEIYDFFDITIPIFQNIKIIMLHVNKNSIKLLIDLITKLNNIDNQLLISSISTNNIDIINNNNYIQNNYQTIPLQSRRVPNFRECKLGNIIIERIFIDTGADISVLSFELFHQLALFHDFKYEFQSFKVNCKTADGALIQLLGKIKMFIQPKGHRGILTEFYLMNHVQLWILIGMNTIDQIINNISIRDKVVEFNLPFHHYSHFIQLDNNNFIYNGKRNYTQKFKIIIPRKTFINPDGEKFNYSLEPTMNQSLYNNNQHKTLTDDIHDRLLELASVGKHHNNKQKSTKRRQHNIKFAKTKKR